MLQTFLDSGDAVGAFLARELRLPRERSFRWDATGKAGTERDQMLIQSIGGVRYETSNGATAVFAGQDSGDAPESPEDLQPPIANPVGRDAMVD